MAKIQNAMRNCEESGQNWDVLSECKPDCFRKWRNGRIHLRRGLYKSNTVQYSRFFLNLPTIMSTVKEKVLWINKYLLESMNSTDSVFRSQRQEDVERYAKRLCLENFCVLDESYAWKSLDKKSPVTPWALMQICDFSSIIFNLRVFNTFWSNWRSFQESITRTLCFISTYGTVCFRNTRNVRG